MKLVRGNRIREWLREGLVWVGLPLLFLLGIYAIQKELTRPRGVSATDRLIKAVIDDDVRAVHSAVQAGADPNQIIRPYGGFFGRPVASMAGDTPLMRAAIRGRLTIVETLLTSGADPSMSGAGGTTPLMMAAIGELPDRHNVIDLLVKNGAEVNSRDASGYTALALAVHNRRKESVRALIAHGSDVNLKLQGRSLLDCTIQWNTPTAIVIDLKRAGAR